MSKFLDSLKRREAQERLSGAQARLRALRVELADELAAAATFTDPGRNAQGLADRRRELQEQARQRFAPRLAELRAEVERDAEAVTSWASAQTPRLAEDPVSLMRSQGAWDRARMLLESGRSLRDVLATADAPTALALREWGPTWLRAQTRPPSGMAGIGYQELDPSPLLRSIDDRLAEIHGGDVAEAVNLTRQTEAALAGFGEAAKHVESMVNGTTRPHSDLSAAIATEFATQEASRRYEPEPSDAA